MCEFTLARARKPLAMEEAAAAVGAPGGAVGGGDPVQVFFQEFTKSLVARRPDALPRCGRVPSDPATWDGTGSGAKALYGQYVRQRNALGDAHVLPVQCGGSGTCVGLECLWARSIAPHNPHDP